MSTPDPLSKDDNHSGTWHGVHPSSIRAPQQIAKPNKTLYLFTSLGCEALLSQDAVAAARACTIHPTSPPLIYLAILRHMIFWLRFSSGILKSDVKQLPWVLTSMALELWHLQTSPQMSMLQIVRFSHGHSFQGHALPVLLLLHGRPLNLVLLHLPSPLLLLLQNWSSGKRNTLPNHPAHAACEKAAAKAHAAAKKDDANEGQEANLSAEDNTTLPQPPATPVTGANIKDDAMIPDVETPDASAANSTTALTATTISLVTICDATKGMSRVQKDSWIKTKIVSGDIDVIMGDPTGTSTNSSKYSYAS
ncbi:hypothetical protein F4703DRAFT_1795634 [Phycomyces blakesleeanus]